MIVADINSDGAAAVAETLSDAHVDAKAITGNVADRPGVEAMIAVGTKTFAPSTIFMTALALQGVLHS